MSIISDLFKELLGMFLGDARLALATLFLVAGVVGLVTALRAGPLVSGGTLLFGCQAILVEAASRGARVRNRR
jgi:hypothetical protein